jgi:glycosyltransferase involved in cell wall biosynthesis
MPDTIVPTEKATLEAAEKYYNVSLPCCVVIPCYNEAGRLPLAEFAQFLTSGKDAEISFLFVNDGSSDTTLTILRQLTERFPERVDVLDLQPNGGKAEAVRRGMLSVIAEGRASVTGFWDADLATPLYEIRSMLNIMTPNPGLELVFGSRVMLLGREIRRQALRHYLGRGFATAVSQLLDLPIYDSQCGAKLFRITPDLNEVLREPFQSRWIFDVEILTRFLSLFGGDLELTRKRIYEWPLSEWTDVAGSKVHPTDFFRAFGELASIYRSYRRGLRSRKPSTEAPARTVEMGGDAPIAGLAAAAAAASVADASALVSADSSEP